MTSSTDTPLLSIIIPVFNEEGNLALVADRIDKTLADNTTYELIFVDDGSSDTSLSIIKTLADHSPHIRYASFSRNFGHEAASSCGFNMARGQAAVLMDGDLQDPPELIPQMIELWQQGNEVVMARRRSRLDESSFKRTSAGLFYRLMSRLSDVDIPLDVGDFRLVDRQVINAFNRFTERNRFVRGLFAWAGFRQTYLEYDRPGRHAGETKYNTGKLIFLSLDALFSCTLVPLRMITFFGGLITLLSFLLILVIVAQKLLGQLEIDGYALVSTGLFFLGGTILVFLGIIGEYVGKTFQEVQGRPLYLVRECSDRTTL